MIKNLWMTFFATTLILAACGTSPTPIPPPAKTETPAAPQSGFASSDNVIASAEVRPARKSQMSFVISGPVEDVFVKEGEPVTAGQVLITLYAPDLELSVTSAELAAKSAELENSYWLPHRFDRPPERQAQSKAEWDRALRSLDVARASFSQTSLYAPFDGIILDVALQVGELAQSGQAVIVLGDTANMQVVTTDLSERDVPAVKIGQSVNIYIESLDARVQGKVVRISPISETVGGDVVYPVTIELNEQPDGLLWGMSAEVEILTK